MKLPADQYVSRSDADLLVASGGGDMLAFRALYRRLSKVLYSVAYKIVGNESDAEELMQETFTELWKKATSYDPSRAKPLTLAIRIVRNRSIDRIRKGKRRQEILAESSPEIVCFTQAEEQRKISEAAEIQEASEAVKAALSKLNPDQRKMLDLAYFKGMSQSEIAESLSEALGTVKSRIRRGLDKLRRELRGIDG